MVSEIRGTLKVKNEEKNNLNLANKVLNRQDVLILGGLNSGISLYNVFNGVNNLHCLNVLDLFSDSVLENNLSYWCICEK